MRGTCGLRDLTRCSDHDGSLRAADNCATSAVQQLHIAKHVTNDRKVLGFPALALSLFAPLTPLPGKGPSGPSKHGPHTNEEKWISFISVQSLSNLASDKSISVCFHSLFWLQKQSLDTKGKSSHVCFCK